MRIFELRSVHMIEVLCDILNYALYTRVTENVILLSRAWRRCMAVSGLPANQTCTLCCLRFLCMCSAQYYRWKWLEGHTSSAPQNTILRSSHSYTDFLAWFARIVTGKHLCTRDLRCAFQITFCDVIWQTHGLFCVFWILIQNCASRI